MHFLHPTHQKFLFALLDADVEFLLIGGYAVIYHGYIRATGDMDVWLKPTNENKQKTIVALKQAEVHPEDLKLLEEAFDFTGVVVFHFGQQPERIDFLTKVQGLDFEKANERKEFMNIKNRQIPILNLDDLIVSKLIAGRPQDKADVEMLQRIVIDKRIEP
jgi:hypothetical protein